MSEALPPAPDDLGHSAAAAAAASAVLHTEDGAQQSRQRKRSMEEADQEGAVAVVAEKRARFEVPGTSQPMNPSTAAPPPLKEGNPAAAEPQNNNGNANNPQQNQNELDHSRRMRITMSPYTAELLKIQAQEAVDAEQVAADAAAAAAMSSSAAKRELTPSIDTDRCGAVTNNVTTTSTTQQQIATPSLPSLFRKEVVASTTKTPPPSNRSSSITTTTTASLHLDNHSEPAAAQKQYFENDESAVNLFNEKVKPNHKIQLFLRLIVSTVIGVAVFASVFSTVKAFRLSPSNNVNYQQQPSAWWWPSWSQQQHEKIAQDSGRSASALTNMERQPRLTLRDIILDHETGFHLAMAPAFFGFYAYFGVLAAWYDAIREQQQQQNHLSMDIDIGNKNSLPLKSVAGASAGAMTALMLAAGIAPDVAATICEGITIDKFADFPGVGAAFRGNKFEALMHSILLSQNVTGQMEDALFPVAVTAFDLQTMQGHVLQTGSMARAARASATFPGLFQPVAWEDETHNYVFIDGGIADHAGLVGLQQTMPLFGNHKDNKCERVINLSVGGFMTSIPPGPSSLPGNPEVVSIPILRTPLPGPWALHNGPRAFRAAREATAAALDMPLQRVRAKKQRRESAARASKNEDVHYELVIDASSIGRGKK